MDKRTKTKARLAGGYAGAGLAAIGLLFLGEDFPPLHLWLLFTAAFVYLEWRSVEVNDRLFVSPTVMVVLTAAVIFGRESAALGAATMAALGPLTPRDIKERRLFQPVLNFGQMALSAAAAALVLEQFLPRSGLPVRPSQFWLAAVGAALAAVTYSVVNWSLVIYAVRTVFGTQDLRPWVHMEQILVPYLGMGFLGGLLGATYHSVGPVTLPMIFVVFALGYLSVAGFGDLREARAAALRGFVKILETRDLYTRGHTMRVAQYAEMIAEELGYNPDRMEVIRSAALIHDVGKLALPRDLVHKQGRLSEDEYARVQTHAHIVEDMLAEVQFLSPSVRIASAHHSRYDGSGYGGTGHTSGSRPSREAMVLAVADAFDAMTSGRSYRAALTQDYAFEELRRHSGTQFDPEAVEAFIRAVERSGRRFGSSRVRDEAEARKLAESWTVWHD